MVTITGKGDNPKYMNVYESLQKCWFPTSVRIRVSIWGSASWCLCGGICSRWAIIFTSKMEKDIEHTSWPSWPLNCWLVLGGFPFFQNLFSFIGTSRTVMGVCHPQQYNSPALAPPATATATSATSVLFASKTNIHLPRHRYCWHF